MTLDELLQIQAPLGPSYSRTITDVAQRILDKANQGLANAVEEGITEDEAGYREEAGKAVGTRRQLLALATLLASYERYDTGARVRILSALAVGSERLIEEHKMIAEEFESSDVYYVNYLGLNPASSAYVSHQPSQIQSEEVRGPYYSLDEARQALADLIEENSF
jgi:hypothetical protein